MAEQPKYFEIEDYETGKRYRVEAYADDVTYDEAVQHLSSLPEEEWVQYEYKAPAPAKQAPVSVEMENATVTREQAPTNNIETTAKMGIDRIGEYENYEITPFSPEDEAEYLRLNKDPNVSGKEIQDWARSRGAEVQIDEERLQRYRDAVAKGEGFADEITYGRIEDTLLGDYVPQVDPTIDSDFGAALEEGMAYNPMGLATRGLSDLFDVEQGGFDKETLRKRFPDMSEEQIERVHDNLIGELRRRELINANVQVDTRDVNPLVDFAGDMIGGASPVDLIPLGRGSTVGRKLVEAAGYNFAVDAALQAGDIAYGAQQSYDPVQGAVAAASGAALQGTVNLGAAGLKRVFRRTPDSPAPASNRAPIVVPEGDARTKAYKEQLVQAQAGIVEQVNELTYGWTNAPEITVHENFKDLPGVDKTAIGVYTEKTLPDGTVVPAIEINTQALLRKAKKEKLSPESLVEAVTFHETLGHHGLLSVFGKDLELFLDDIYTNGDAKFRKEVDKWLADNPTAYGKLGPERRRIFATEEVLAEASEKGPITRSKLDGLANYIKDFARTRLGRFSMDLKYSQREVRSYLAVAHERTMKGQHSGETPDTVRNMDDPDYASTDNTFSSGSQRPKADARSQAEARKQFWKNKQNPDWNPEDPNGLPTEPKYMAGDNNGMFPEEIRQLQEGATRIKSPKELLEAGEKDSMLAAVIDPSGKIWKLASSDDPRGDHATFFTNISKQMHPEIKGEAAEKLFDAGIVSKYIPVRNYGGEWAIDIAENVANQKQLDTVASIEFLVKRQGLSVDIAKYTANVEMALGGIAASPIKTVSNKYMRGDRKTSDEGDFERRMTMILEEVKEAYVPTERSQAEAQRAASLAGLRSRQYKSEKGLEDLDVRLFQYDAVNDRYQAKLLRLADRMENPKDANEYVRASDEFKKTLYEYKLLSAKIQGDQAQIARALNAMKAISLTKRKINETLGLLDDTFKNKTEAEAFAALDDPEVLNALVKMMSAQIKAGNKLGAAKIAEKVGKPYWWQYVLSYLHNSMLSGLGTHAVNAYDAVNVLGRKLEERAIGGAIGQTRKALGAKDTMSMMEGVGFSYGILRALLDVETYKNTYRAFKEGYEFQPFDARIERQDARIPGLSVINDLLYASDMFWRSFHMSANLYSLGIRKAYKDGFTGKQLFEEGYANAINADKELFDEAKLHADEALLVDKPSAFTSWVESGKNIKPNMSAGEQVRAFTLNLLFPFLRVSDRLIFQALKRVPVVAFMDHNTRREWSIGGAARDSVLARQMMGAAILTYYWEMADPANADQEGYIEGFGDEDYQKTQALEATGYRPQSVTNEEGVMQNANQINITANPFNTNNNIAVAVATARQTYEKSKKTEQDANQLALFLTATMRAGGKFLLEQGYADNVTPYVAALESNPQQETNAANAVGELATRAVPALVRQLNQMYFDPIKRDTTGDKSFQDRVVGKVQAGIPGLSDLLPSNRTSLGEEQEQGRTLLRLGDGTPIKQGDPYTELRKLEREVSDPVLTEFRGSFTYEGAEIKLNAFEKNKWQAVQGTYLKEVMTEWVTSDDWKQMTTEEKVDVVKDIKQEAYDYAKEQLLDEILDARGYGE